MRRARLTLALLVALGVLAGCTPIPDVHDTPSPSDTQSAEHAAAEQRAQAWLDQAALPPGAVSVEEAPAGFTSYYGWPCRPVAQTNGYWTVADVTVGEAANWLTDHPTPGLIVPLQTRYSDDPEVGEASVGQVPEPDAQEGIVFTIAKTPVGVGIRAAAAAEYASATCPEGVTLGGVGQG